MRLPGLEGPRDGAVRVVEIAERETVCRADGHARRVESVLHAMDAERALVGVPVRVHEARVVRARGQARLAADALVGRHEHDAAPVIHVARPGRAAGDAGRVVAVVAPLRADLHVERRKAADGLVRDPVAVEALRHAVLGLAGDHAVHAPDAQPGVDCHAVACHRLRLRFDGDEVDVHAGAAHQRIGAGSG